MNLQENKNNTLIRKQIHKHIFRLNVNFISYFSLTKKQAKIVVKLFENKKNVICICYIYL